jgi:hypothetical protein
MSKLWIGSMATLALLGALWAGPASAQPARGRGFEGHEVERWRHGDIARFHERDMERWRGGRWFHGEHIGRQGWWWVVDGAWYFYPVPVYPYPDPYSPPQVVVQVPASATVPAPPPAAAPSAPQNWYYCASQQEYYPYITSCPEPWQPVPATPPGR